MNKQQQAVEEFHRTMGLEIGNYRNPEVGERAAVVRRTKLIKEELDELFWALRSGDLVEAADALGDLLYVTLGSAVEFGIDMSVAELAAWQSPGNEYQRVSPMMLPWRQAKRLKDHIELEFIRLKDAMDSTDATHVAERLDNLASSIEDAAINLCIDLVPVFEEVHRSNMTKVGGHRNDFGKFIKPDTYEPANIKAVLEAQGAKF